MGHNVNGDHSRRNFLCTTSNQNIFNIQQFKSCTEGINPFLKLQKYYFDLNLINTIPISSYFPCQFAKYNIDITFQNKQDGSSNDFHGNIFQI